MPVPYFIKIDDAIAFIVEFLRTPRPDDGYPKFGYEIYLPMVMVAYVREIEHSTEHVSRLWDSPRAKELSPIFYKAAWELCRRGVLRPGLKSLGEQATADGASGNGYSLTTLGRHWIQQDARSALLAGPDRLSQMFDKLSSRFGLGISKRATEAVSCHTFGAYIACCAMCGAGAESILWAVAIAKSGGEAATLADYRTANGRKKVIDRVVGQVRQAIAEPFRSATGLLSYWRDDAAHGLASTISEIEAHEASARLLRFAQFAADNWDELTRS